MLPERTKSVSAILLLQLAACTSPSDAEGPDAQDPGPDSGIRLACPPAGPFGVQVGDDLPSGALVDCDGIPVDLQGLCEKKASWLFVFAGW